MSCTSDYDPVSTGTITNDEAVHRKPVPGSTDAATPPPSDEDQVEEDDEKVDQIVHEQTNHVFQERRWEKFLNWVLSATGTAAAIVFGMWAPLSYKATMDSNSGNNASQNAVTEAIAQAAQSANEAAITQGAMLNEMNAGVGEMKLRMSDMNSTLNDLNSRVAAIGQLRLLDFCASRTGNKECSQASAVELKSIVSYLAEIPTPAVSVAGGLPTASSTTRSSPFSAPTTSATAGNEQSTGTSKTLSVPAILGITFAALAFIGWVTGVYLFLLRSRRKRRVNTLNPQR